MITQDREILILESIYASRKPIHQRDIAEIVGLSLGMTNGILKRLAEKGLLKIRKVNNRNIRYIVSPKGVEAITRKSYRYFKRTIKNVVNYREALEAFAHRIKHSGFDGIVLIGVSDLDFLVEYACMRHALAYVKDDDGYEGRVFKLYSESYIPDEDTKRGSYSGEDGEPGAAFLQDLLLWEDEAGKG